MVLYDLEKLLTETEVEEEADGEDEEVDGDASVKEENVGQAEVGAKVGTSPALPSGEVVIHENVGTSTTLLAGEVAGLKSLKPRLLQYLNC